MAKLLVSGMANTGKTYLLQTLTDVLVVANDGKKYPFKQPHVNIPEFCTADEFISSVTEAMEKYKEKLGSYPSTVVIDSVSKTWLDIEAHYLRTVSSFPYGPIGKDISAVMHFLENELAKNGFNLIFVSHAFKDDTEMALVNAGGSWGKKGGVLSEVDNAIYIENKGKKRVIYLKNHKLARTLQDVGEEDSVSSDDFNLQEYLNMLVANETEADEWELV